MYILKLLVLLHLLVSTQIEAERKIFAGELAKDTKAIPFIVQIVAYTGPTIPGTRVGTSTCGGSYIRTNWILSAAHCFKDQMPVKNNKPKFDVELCMGSIGPSCPEPLMRMASELHLHTDGPKYSEHDIALIKIEKPWVLGPTIQLAKFPPPKVPIKSYHNKKCVVAGWGRTDVTVQGTTLKVGTVKLFVGPKAQCYITYPDRQICAKGDTAITCQGDSGGPLSCDGLLVGVVESGVGACNSTETKTSIFNMVDAYRDWIVGIAGAGNSIVPNKFCLCIFSVIATFN